ncbi:MAG TPA: helix-turn-helix domain-containing protein [Bryobacteraceae bacterium]|nr:helix-turn-helix domain-containing protein [Bryobacteraceae bacterium]
MNETEKLTVPEACKLLGISRPTLYKRMAEWGLAFVPGNPLLEKEQRFFYRADVERVKASAGLKRNSSS